MRKFVKINIKHVDDILEKVSLCNAIELKYYIIYKQLPIIGNLSVLENIALPMSYHKGMKIKQLISTIQDYLNIFNLSEKIHNRRDTLSNYEIFLVKYITALMFPVELILFIMPLDHVGIEHSHHLMDFFIKCNENYAILDYNENYDKYAQISNIIKLEYDEWLTQDLRV
ncbi:MAG: hypothetical protein N3C60_00855 [Calditerrivibrio sp.]|nr:hypothetical protein [Calditerrivibrio sp.]